MSAIPVDNIVRFIPPSSERLSKLTRSIEWFRIRFLLGVHNDLQSALILSRTEFRRIGGLGAGEP
jgi:hypothetical protein